MCCASGDRERRVQIEDTINVTEINSYETWKLQIESCVRKGSNSEIKQEENKKASKLLNLYGFRYEPMTQKREREHSAHCIDPAFDRSTATLPGGVDSMWLEKRDECWSKPRCNRQGCSR